MGEPNRSPNDSDLVRVMETTAHHPQSARVDCCPAAPEASFAALQLQSAPSEALGCSCRSWPTSSVEGRPSPQTWSPTTPPGTAVACRMGSRRRLWNLSCSSGLLKMVSVVIDEHSERLTDRPLLSSWGDVDLLPVLVLQGANELH